jgi:hypothetical protein
MDHSFLSLGDMLAFVGLIIAAFQLVKPRYLLIWKLSNNFIKAVAIALLVVGYLSPLASILVPDTKPLLDGLSFDRLLQVSGFVAITLGLIIVAFIFSRFNYRSLVTNVTKYRFHFFRYPRKNWRNLQLQVERNKIITNRSAKKFHTITSLFLVRGHIEEVVEITRLNLRPLVSSARQYSPMPSNFPGAENREPPKPNGANYAFEALYQLLTDDAVMKHICTNDRFFLHAIVDCELKSSDGSVRSEFANVLYSNIVEHLVLTPGSLLYTQRDAHSGSARFANVYDLLTDDKITRRQHIIPSMLTWNMSKTDLQLDDYTDVLLKLLERMIDSYKAQPGSTELLGNIRQIFDQLIGDEGVTRRLAFDKKARQHYADDSTGSMAFKVFSKLHLAMSTGLVYKSDDPDSFKTNDAELKTENQHYIWDQTTLTGVVAYKIYELIEDLTIFFQDTDDPDDSVRRELFNYLVIHVDTAVAQRFQELLYERLFDKAIYGVLEKYSTNIQGYYPNILRYLIDFLTPFQNHLDNAEAKAQAKLKGIMGNELKEALLAGKMMSNDEPMKDVLLPTSVKATINKSSKSVKYYHVDAKGKKILIDLSNPNQTTTAPVVKTVRKARKRKQNT